MLQFVSITAALFVIYLQLVKLLELREANHVEFCKIKSMVEEILQLYRNSELRAIVELLMDPTWVATGLKVDFDTLVSDVGVFIPLPITKTSCTVKYSVVHKEQVSRAVQFRISGQESFSFFFFFNLFFPFSFS